ncbi:MAG: ATP-binding cassette domain-containing protein [Acholeplasmatales bacterium]|nr:ATP-binding cassette domain-containing protein [Acholeplasmatales bacterium]MBQ6783455.1 ATP-binding cassette domain-containing protein [Acholeplasmatales bacterium]
MLKLTNVSKKYREHIVFNSVTIDMSNPGLYVFQGINGSGKSTILKVLCGVIYKSEGRIEKDVSISYLPDKFNMPKLMKAKAYVDSILNMYGIKDSSDELISKFQIPNKRIGDLSKGNQQKLGLLQVLYNEADCYVLDEPLDGLDEFAKHLVKDIIKEYIDKGKIIIMSLHGKNLFNELKPTVFDIKDGFINAKQKRKKKEEIDDGEEKEL